MLPHPPLSTLFPYTTLFRSGHQNYQKITNPLRQLRTGGKKGNCEKILFLVLKCWRYQGKGEGQGDRKSTRLNSSHVEISYAVFCLKKKTRRHSGFSARRRRG